MTDLALSIPSSLVTPAPTLLTEILPLLAGSVAGALAVAAVAATNTQISKRGKKKQKEKSVAEPK